MGFKLASLFVTVEAQTKKYTDQLSGLKKKTAEAGGDIAGTSFAPDFGQITTVLASLPAQIAKIMTPVAGQVGSAIADGLKPAARSGTVLEKLFGRIVAIVQKVGKAILRFYRFDIAIKGLTLLRAGVDALGARLNGSAAKAASAFSRVLSVAIFATRVRQIVDRLNLLLAPARKLGQLLTGVVKTTGRLAAGTARYAMGLGAASKAASGLKSILGEIVLAAGFVAIGYKVVDFFHKATTGASDFRETVDKVDAVLGDAAPAVVKFSDEMADRFGLVKTVTLDAASGFAGLAKGLGNLKGQELADFSTKFTKLAADFSSFANIDFDEAQKSIKIGLTGEPSDVLKQFGVVVNETLTKQYALDSGMKLVNGQLTEQQKLMARAGLITRQLADADDNLELTQDSTANRARKTAGQFANLATTIGTSLLPIVNKALSLFSQFTGFVGRAFEANKATFESWVDRIVWGMELAGSVFRNWSATVEVVRLSVFQSLSNIGEYFAVLGPNIATVGAYIARNFWGFIRDGFNLVIAGIGNISTNFQKLGKAAGEFFTGDLKAFDNIQWTGLTEGFKATVEKFPELLKPVVHDMSDEMAKAFAPILDDVAARTKKVVPQPIKKGVAVDLPEHQEDKKAGNGRIGDLASFANSLQEAVAGKDKAARETAAATKQSAEQLVLANRNLARIAAMTSAAGAGGPMWAIAGLGA